MATELLTLDEAGKRLGISAESVRRLCKSEKLKHIRLGPRNWWYRTTEAWIEEFIQASAVGGDLASQRKGKPAKPSRSRRATVPPSDETFREQLIRLRSS
jgi:excisionase family DNA binding protein